MQVNSRAVLWGGVIVAIVLVMAFLVLPAIFVALGVAVCLLVALVVVNRMREASDAAREADNDESTSRLDTLEGLDQEPYDATTFDSAVYGSSRRDTLFDDTPEYEPPAETEQYEEFVEPTAEWSPGQRDTSTGFAPRDDDVDEYQTTYQASEYTSAFEAPTESDQFVETEFEEYKGPSRQVADFEYDSTNLADPVADYRLDDLDTASVLADEGVIDETKVTTAESILAASQVSRFEPETISDEESNEETREILGRVAALLAKYE
jgi:hypothetical protein